MKDKKKKNKKSESVKLNFMTGVGQNSLGVRGLFLLMDPLAMHLWEGLDQGVPLPLPQSPPSSLIPQSPEDWNGQLSQRKERVKGQCCCLSRSLMRHKLKKAQEEESLPLAPESLDLGGSPQNSVPSHIKEMNCEHCWGFPCSYEF